MTKFVYLARHGETDWNVEGRWQGHTDVPLNQAGEAQARGIARTLRNVGLCGVVSSDLERAHHTARIVAQNLGLTVVYVDADLRERRFGLFEGLTREECAARYPDAWRGWVEERRVPQGGEGQEELAARVVAAVLRAADRVARKAAPALVVTHGAALRAAVNVAGAMPPPVQNGAIWRLEVAEGAPTRIVAAEPV